MQPAALSLGRCAPLDERLSALPGGVAVSPAQPPASLPRHGRKRCCAVARRGRTRLNQARPRGCEARFAPGRRGAAEPRPARGPRSSTCRPLFTVPCGRRSAAPVTSACSHRPRLQPPRRGCRYLAPRRLPSSVADMVACLSPDSGMTMHDCLPPCMAATMASVSQFWHHQEQATRCSVPASAPVCRASPGSYKIASPVRVLLTPPARLSTSCHGSIRRHGSAPAARTRDGRRPALPAGRQLRGGGAQHGRVRAVFAAVLLSGPRSSPS